MAYWGSKSIDILQDGLLILVPVASNLNRVPSTRHPETLNPKPPKPPKPHLPKPFKTRPRILVATAIVDVAAWAPQLKCHGFSWSQSTQEPGRLLSKVGSLLGFLKGIYKGFYKGSYRVVRQLLELFQEGFGGFGV